MRNKFKGFTLIECLVALAILGIAALTMAEIYAGVSRRNLSNHYVNTSLSYQMKMVEKAAGTDALPVYYGDTTNTPDTHSFSQSGDCKIPSAAGVSANRNYIQITKRDNTGKVPATGSKQIYEFPVDYYVLLSRDANDKPSNDADYNGAPENEMALRYKYVVGHSNK